MSKGAKSDTTKETTSSARASTDKRAIRKAAADKELAQGFRGVEVDSTPNENYTVKGVTSGAPTPETDADAAAKAREDTGLGLSALEASAREKKLIQDNAANTAKLKGGNS